MKKIIAFTLLMIVLSVQVSAFSFKFPWQKEKPIVQEQNNEQIELVQQKVLLNADNVIELINANKYSYMLKHFSGDSFCVATEERELYASVNDDSKLELLNYKPSCYKIKTTEETLNAVYKKYQEQGYITDKELQETFSLPLGLKIKILRISIFG